MLSLAQIRTDLKEIRYYYSKQKLFDSLSKSVAENAVIEKAAQYNHAVKNAPARLYDVYVSLYVQNNSQAALAYDWDVSSDYIKMLNKRLCEFLQTQLKG